MESDWEMLVLVLLSRRGQNESRSRQVFWLFQDITKYFTIPPEIKFTNGSCEQVWDTSGRDTLRGHVRPTIFYFNHRALWGPLADHSVSPQGGPSIPALNVTVILDTRFKHELNRTYKQLCSDVNFINI